MEGNGVSMCQVCEEQMKPKTPSIACISYQKYVHLITYTYRKAKKLNGKFNCSKCFMSEIVQQQKIWMLKIINVVTMLAGFVPEIYVMFIF